MTIKKIEFKNKTMYIKTCKETFCISVAKKGWSFFTKGKIKKTLVGKEIHDIILGEEIFDSFCFYGTVDVKIITNEGEYLILQKSKIRAEKIA